MFKFRKRNFYVVFLLGFIIFLSGCDLNNVEVTTEPNQVNELVSKSKELEVKDISSEFIINSKTLSTYAYQNDPAISYININEFITFLDGSLVDLNITQGDQLLISYTFDLPEDYIEQYGSSTYTYEMSLDPNNDSISFNDFDMISYLNTESQTQYVTDIKLKAFESESVDNSIEIDLKLYDMDLVKYNNDFYMPLYLANLFLTGTYLNVYEMNDDLYVFDTSSDFSQLINQFEENESLDVSNISIHTKNYLALYFDYFYGLKQYQNIDTYLTDLNDYDFESVNSFNDLDELIAKFLNSQNDIHTAYLTAGYMNKDFTSDETNDKHTKFLESYLGNQCFNRSSEISSTRYGNTLVISVNQFTLSTRSLLMPVMEEAKNYNDIVIDLSCNTGGNLVGVLELLSYLSSEEIPISYGNPLTGAKTTEYYQSTFNDYLDKNYYIYTSPTTFSAANLFTSIVKDEELGIIIGEKTSGGASAITITVLPDGSIIQNSSNLTFVNKAGIVVEDGIDVDLNFDRSVPINEVIYEIESFYESNEVNVVREQTSNSTILNFNIKKSTALFDTSYFTLAIYDYETNALVSEETFNDVHFSYTLPKVIGDDTYNLIIYANYQTIKFPIYEEVIDDHSNEFDLNAKMIPIEGEVKGYSHLFGEMDAYQFTINEEGLYRITVDGDYTYYSIFNEDGELIELGYDIQFKPGTYYLVAPIYKTGYYSIKINQLFDDRLGPNTVELSPGIQYHSLKFDYLMDDESFEFTVLEDSMVTFTWDFPTDLNYSIQKTTGELLTVINEWAPHEDQLPQEIKLVLLKGTYIVKITDDIIGEVNLITYLTTDYQDYSDDASLTSTNYGELTVGSNTMEFLTHFDKDIYYIDITEPGNYSFDYNQTIGFVHLITIQDGFRMLFPNDQIYLSKGRHYFVFDSFFPMQNPTIEFIFNKEVN